MTALAPHTPFLQIFALLFGAVVGSFLNVVIARLPKGESIVWPGSHCPKCGHKIRWYDNLPVVSYLWLRAKCRDCGQPISPRYPMIELLGALLALALERRYGVALATLAFFAFAAALVAIAYIDLDTWLIPHELSLPLIAAGLAYAPLNPRLGHWWLAPLGAALGAGGFALVAVLGKWVFKKEALGWGDVILIAGVGAWLGPGALLPVVLIASIVGIVYGVVMIATRKSTPSPQPPAPSPQPSPLDEDAEVPWTPDPHAITFGPPLAIAALVMLLLGDALAALFETVMRRLWS